MRIGIDEPTGTPRLSALRWGVLVASVALAGCAGRDRPVTQIPVPVACVRADQVPAEVPPTNLPTDARQAADALGATVLALRANERIWRAIIQPCVRN